MLWFWVRVLEASLAGESSLVETEAGARIRANFKATELKQNVLKAHRDSHNCPR